MALCGTGKAGHICYCLLYTSLSLQSILKIPDISVSDMTVITELQEQIAKNRLFSYLGGAEDEQQSEENTI